MDPDPQYPESSGGTLVVKNPPLSIKPSKCKRRERCLQHVIQNVSPHWRTLVGDNAVIVGVAQPAQHPPAPLQLVLHDEAARRLSLPPQRRRFLRQRLPPQGGRISVNVAFYFKRPGTLESTTKRTLTRPFFPLSCRIYTAVGVHQALVP